jgi:hypothetical protein
MQNMNEMSEAESLRRRIERLESNSKIHDGVCEMTSSPNKMAMRMCTPQEELDNLISELHKRCTILQELKDSLPVKMSESAGDGIRLLLAYYVKG